MHYIVQSKYIAQCNIVKRLPIRLVCTIQTKYVFLLVLFKLKTFTHCFLLVFIVCLPMLVAAASAKEHSIYMLQLNGPLRIVYTIHLKNLSYIRTILTDTIVLDSVYFFVFFLAYVYHEHAHFCVITN